MYTATVCCRAWEGCDGSRCNRLSFSWPAVLISSFGEKQLDSKRRTAVLNRRICLTRQSGDCKKPWYFPAITNTSIETRANLPCHNIGVTSHCADVSPSNRRYVLWQRKILNARYLQPSHRRLGYPTYSALGLLQRRSPMAV